MSSLTSSSQIQTPCTLDFVPVDLGWSDLRPSLEEFHLLLLKQFGGTESLASLHLASLYALLSGPFDIHTYNTCFDMLDEIVDAADDNNEVDDLLDAIDRSLDNWYLAHTARLSTEQKQPSLAPTEKKSKHHASGWDHPGNEWWAPSQDLLENCNLSTLEHYFHTFLCLGDHGRAARDAITNEVDERLTDARITQHSLSGNKRASQKKLCHEMENLLTLFRTLETSEQDDDAPGAGSKGVLSPTSLADGCCCLGRSKAAKCNSNKTDGMPPFAPMSKNARKKLARKLVMQVLEPTSPVAMLKATPDLT